VEIRFKDVIAGDVKYVAAFVNLEKVGVENRQRMIEEKDRELAEKEKVIADREKELIRKSLVIFLTILIRKPI
jgi:uncharacterized protein (DUF3084 family)